ncbi:MAG: hypothetical protein GC131_04450 [Alphaproteobacteria bacterium]|nr:hypothetical protein [Alphaproteobacteria bacterium]
MTFSEMVKKFGHTMAIDILMSVEKMARVQVDQTWLALSEEERLKRAYEALDRLDEERQAQADGQQQIRARQSAR